jgi:hypothetical protein
MAHHIMQHSFEIGWVITQISIADQAVFYCPQYPEVIPDSQESLLDFGE